MKQQSTPVVTTQPKSTLISYNLANETEKFGEKKPDCGNKITDCCVEAIAAIKKHWNNHDNRPCLRFDGIGGVHL
jgi:hypothetical protein